MYPHPFQYHQPGTVREALDLLANLEGEARCLAGGQSLIPSMKLRLSQPQHLVDLTGIAELRGIAVVADEVAVGAMVTHRRVESSQLLGQQLPYLCEVAGKIADPQVRNRGTIGGSLANADPAADYPAALLALDGVVEAIGLEGKREIRADDWSQGLMVTALRQGEILTRVRFPLSRGRQGTAYVKVPHPASRFAVVGVAVRIVMDRQGVCLDCRIAITGVGEKVQRARTAEAALAGTALSDAELQAAAEKVAAEVEVMQDDLLSEPAKRHICLATARKALKLAKIGECP
jgi:carbon-monoxide dehydrogenase medium subunit